MTLRRAQESRKMGNQPQNHGVAKGAHSQVHKPVLVEVQLPMDAAAKILEAWSQLWGSDSLQGVEGKSWAWAP